MWRWWRKDALLGGELTQWQLDCLDWLLQHTGGLDALRARRLVLPTREHFPHRVEYSHASAVALFEQVKRHAGMADWACELAPHQSAPDTKVSSVAFVQGAPQSPAGTFRTRQDGSVLVTYDPQQLADPMSMVATLAHELAHYRTAVFPEPPPGGWEVWEPATDLAAVFLGFGVFLANTRFRFNHFNDGRRSGWQWRHQGYLSEPEVLHMQALVSLAMGVPASTTLGPLKPALRGIFKRVYRDAERALAASGLLTGARSASMA